MSVPAGVEGGGSECSVFSSKWDPSERHRTPNCSNYRQQKCLRTLDVCGCLFTTHCCVCVHLDGTNADDTFYGHVTSFPFIVIIIVIVPRGIGLLQTSSVFSFSSTLVRDGAIVWREEKLSKLVKVNVVRANSQNNHICFNSTDKGKLDHPLEYWDLLPSDQCKGACSNGLGDDSVYVSWTSQKHLPHAILTFNRECISDEQNDLPDEKAHLV